MTAGGPHTDPAEVTGGQRARPLSPEDLSILALESETVVGHTCKVIVLRERIDADRLRSSIAARLHLAPELCLRLQEIDGVPCWVPDPGVDLRAHVLVCECAEPPDRAGLASIVARTFEQRLDRAAPLWRLDAIAQLADGGSALIWRVHHALADGSTVMRMAAAALWDEEPGSGMQTAQRQKLPGTPGQADPPEGHRRFEGARVATRQVPHGWHRSPFDGHVGARRSMAFATADLEALRAAARRHGGATVNDAVLCVVAGGLRRWLESQHGRLGTVRVKVPVSLHGTTHDAVADAGNRDSFFCLDLPLGSGDPVERLTAIARATRVRKQGHDAQHLDALMHELAGVPRLRRFVEQVLAHPRSFALNVSNVQGPRNRVRVLGAPVRAMYTFAEIRDHHALRVAVVSCGDALTFGLVADPTLLPDVEHLGRAMQDEAEALGGSAS